MPSHYRPLPVKAFNATRKVLLKIGLKQKAFDADEIFESVEKNLKLSSSEDYSEFRQRLSMMCQDLNTRARLHPVGALLTRLSLQNTVKNRLEIDHWIAQHPQTLQREIKQPVFILGLPRTGTTALFNILSSVEGIRSPLGWEVNKPVPPVQYASKDTDPRIKQTHREFEGFFYLTPNIRTIHDFGALLPQECIAITQYDLYTGQFWFCYDIPEYYEWYKQYDALPSLQFHRRFAQNLMSDFPEQQWLFKTPFHLGILEQLLTVYPDARIIQTHRDPMEVMGSSCSFAWHLRSTFSDDINNRQIGQDQLEYWSGCLNHSVQVREKLSHLSSQFYDVDYKSFVAKPVETVSGILEFLGRESDQQTTEKLIAFAQDNQKDKHGKHVYSLEDYQLDAHKDRVHFEDYCREFGL
jgi:hypothetical protein